MIWHERNKRPLFLGDTFEIFIYKTEIKDNVRSPRLERVLDLSIMAFLFSTERFASDRSAVTRVIDILWWETRLITLHPQLFHFKRMQWTWILLQLKINHHHHASYRPWNVIGSCAAQSQHCCTLGYICRERRWPTCRQICALGSQTRLSASCLSPGWRREYSYERYTERTLS